MTIIEKLLTLIKSLGAGIAFLIPGLKGKKVIYDTSLNLVLSRDAKEITKNFWPPFFTFLLTVIGILIPIVFLSRPLELTINNAFLVMSCLFAGFMAGSIPDIVRDLKSEEIKKHHYLILLLTLVLFVVMCVMFVIKKVNVNNLFRLDGSIFGGSILAGVIASIGLTLPGISGALLIYGLGFYRPLLSYYGAVKNNPNLFGQLLGSLSCFLVGLIIGYILFSFVYKLLIKKHKVTLYFIVIGLIVGAIFSTFYNNPMISYYKLYFDTRQWEYYVAPFALFGGVVITFAYSIYIKKIKK